MLGDRWLIEARTLALDNEALTDPHDLEVVKEALLFAEDMRLNLKTKRGFSRLQRAQKYCRTAKDVLQFVKAISDRAADDMLGQGSNPNSRDPNLAHVLLTDDRPLACGDGISPNQLVSPLNLTDLRDAGKTSSFVESDRDSISNALSAMKRENEPDLHALARHFEECGAVASVDPCSQLSGQPYCHSYSAPSINPKLDLYFPHLAQPQEQRQKPQHQHPKHPRHQHQQGSFDSDDTELDMDSAFVTTAVLPSRASTSITSTFSQTQHDSSSTYSAFSDYGAVTPSLQASQEITNTLSSQPGTSYSCVRPTFPCSPSSMTSITPANNPSSSHVASLSALQCQTQVYQVRATEDKLHEVERVGDYQCRCRSMKGPRYHYQRLGDHDAIGLQLLASGQYLKSATVTWQSTTTNSTTTPSSSSSPSETAASLSRQYLQGFGQSQCSPSDLISSQPREHVPTSLPDRPDPPCKLSCNHMQESSPQRDNVISTPTQEHVPTSQFSPSCIPIPPDKLHPTLSCWIKNMNKLSSLIDRLQELASSAPEEHRSQLLRQVVALRATSKKQKEHFTEFLQLSEEYANRYLLDISVEIKQQGSFLEKLEGCLEAAKKLRGEVVDLKKLYESGTARAMQDLRAATLPRPLPEDQALFSEVDLVLTEIRRCYMELDKFWTGEISRAVEALKMRRVDPTDLERWKNFQENLKKTIESWKTKIPSNPAQILRHDNLYLSEEANIGEIASSFSTAMGSLTSALDRLFSSNSLKYTRSGSSSIQPIYVAFAANSDLCLSLLRRCVQYGEKVIGPPSIGLPRSHGGVSSHDLLERTMRLQSEMTGISVENAVSVQGSRKFKAVYNEALSLEQKTTSGLNTLLRKLSSWVTITDGHVLPDAALPDVITPEQLRKLWERARHSVCVALATMKNEPVPQLSTRPLSVVKRWLSLVD